jgi:hypothetical protein
VGGAGGVDVNGELYQCGVCGQCYALTSFAGFTNMLRQPIVKTATM